MAKHTELGNISVPTGSYEKDGATKKRYKTIGVLMHTTEDDGSERFWCRLDADIFHAALFALVKGVGMKKGDDRVSAPVFEPRDPDAPKAPKPEQGAEEDSPF